MSFDPEVLVIPRDGVKGRREAPRLPHEELEVARRFSFIHPKGVANQISRDEEKGWMKGIDERAEASGPFGTRGRDVRVRRMHEGEIARPRRWLKTEFHRTNHRVGDGAPECAHRPVAVG